MSLSLPAEFQFAAVDGRANRFKVNNTALQLETGMQKGGPATGSSTPRSSSYDVFDDTKQVPSAVNPESKSVNTEPLPVGNVPFTIPRHAENVPIPMERIMGNIRELGSMMPDESGMKYVLEQEQKKKQQVTNLREFQVAAMFRGEYHWIESGDGYSHQFTSVGAQHTIDFKIPAGNKNRLNMLGAGNIIDASWDNAATDIVGHIYEIDKALHRLTGQRLRTIRTSSTVLAALVKNTSVINAGGSSNPPIQSQVLDEVNDVYIVKLRAFPHIEFHINDTALTLATGDKALIGEKYISFSTRLEARNHVKHVECAEPFADPGNPTALPKNKIGEFYYHKLTDDPVCYHFHSRYNGLPTLRVPKSVGYGEVIFT